MKSDSRYIENFLEMMVAERSIAKNTLASYKHDMHDLLSFCQFCGKSVIALDYHDLIAFISKLAQKQLSPKSLARKISAIRQLYGFLASESIIKDNPALNLEIPKQPRSLPKPLHLEQLNKLLDAANANKTPEGLRDLAMLEMLYSTGMRISELISLKLSSIQKNSAKSEGLLAVMIKGKGGKERMVVINPQTITVLNNYLEVREFFTRGLENDFLFPSVTQKGQPASLTRQRCFQALKQLAINAGVDQDIVSPHKIRHSFASHLLANGANLRIVQEFLGHSDISSTQIYTQVLTENATKLVLEHHPLANKKAI